MASSLLCCCHRKQPADTTTSAIRKAKTRFGGSRRGISHPKGVAAGDSAARGAIHGYVLAHVEPSAQYCVYSLNGNVFGQTHGTEDRLMKVKNLKCMVSG